MDEAVFSDYLLDMSSKLDLKHYVHGSRVLNIATLQQNEYLICTSKFLIHLKEDGTVQQYDYKFTSCIYIREFNIIIGVTVGIPCLTILNNVIGFPVVTDNYRTNNTFVTQMYYYKNRLFLLGSEFQIYHFSIQRGYSNFSRNYSTKLITSYSHNAPAHSSRFFLDIPKQRVILPTINGFSLISFDGDIVYDNHKLSRNTFKTCCVFNKEIDKFPNPKSLRKPFIRFICIDNDGKIMVVNQDFALVNSFQHYGTNFIYAEFMSHEYVLLVTHNFKVALLDIKTNRYLELFKLPSNPDFIHTFHTPDKIAFGMQYTLQIYSITIPWNLWFKFPASVMQIDRHFSAQNLPVISCLCNDSIFSIIDPNTMRVISSTGTRDTAKINKVLFDRGIIIEENNMYYTRSPDLGSMEKIDERLFMIRDNNTILQEYSDGKEFTNVGIAPVKTQIMCIGKVKDDPCIFFATQNSEIFSFSYPEMEQINRFRFTLEENSILDIYYHNKSGFLFIATKNSILQLDSASFSTKTVLETDINDIVKFNSSYCMTVKNGIHAIIYKIGETIEPLLKIPCPSIITNIAMSNDLFAFATKEQLIYFGKIGSKLGRFKSPFSITSLGILNDQLDLLIGCDYEIMILHVQKFFRYITKPIEYEGEEEIKIEINNSRKSPRISRKMSRKQSRENKRVILSRGARQRTLEEIFLLENHQDQSSDSDSEDLSSTLMKNSISEKERHERIAKDIEEKQRKFRENEIKEGITARRHLRVLLKKIMTSKDDDDSYYMRTHHFTPTNTKENQKNENTAISEDEENTINITDDQEENKEEVFVEKHDSFFATEMEGEIPESAQTVIKKRKRTRREKQKKYSKQDDDLFYDQDFGLKQQDKTTNQQNEQKTVKFAPNNTKEAQNSSIDQNNSKQQNELIKNQLKSQDQEQEHKNKKIHKKKTENKQQKAPSTTLLEDQENFSPKDFNTPDTQVYKHLTDDSSEYQESEPDTDELSPANIQLTATESEYEYYYSDDENQTKKKNSSENSEENVNTRNENEIDEGIDKKHQSTRKIKRISEPETDQTGTDNQININSKIPSSPRRNQLKNSLANQTSSEKLNSSEINSSSNDENNTTKSSNTSLQQNKSNSNHSDDNKDSFTVSEETNEDKNYLLSRKRIPHFPEDEKGNVSPRVQKIVQFIPNSSEEEEINMMNEDNDSNQQQTIDDENQRLISSSPKFEIPLYQEDNEQFEYESILQHQFQTSQSPRGNYHYQSDPYVREMSKIISLRSKVPPLRPNTLASQASYEQQQINDIPEPSQSAPREPLIPRREKELFRMTNLIGEQEYPKVPVVSREYLLDIMFAQKEKLEPIGPIGSRKPEVPSNAIYDLRLMKQIFRTTTKKSKFKPTSKPTGHIDLAFCIIKPSVKKPTSKYKKHRYV